MEHLAALRQFVVSACRQAGGDSAACNALELAVDEACANIVAHGYAGREPGPIVVTFEPRDGEAVVTVCDYGHAFSPDQAPPPDLFSPWQLRRVGGWGIHLMRVMVDRYEYHAGPDGGNLLTLRKRLHSNDSH